MLILNSYHVQLDVFIEEYIIIYEVGNILSIRLPLISEPVLYVAHALAKIAFESPLKWRFIDFVLPLLAG